MKNAQEWASILDNEKPIFSNTLEEQEKELEENEQLEFFRQMRKKYTHARFHPIYHLTRPEGYINDPNGLCFWGGKWHLFYQANTGRIHWGHAISDDMITWRDLPNAIYPLNEDHCFSGGTFVDKDNNRVIAAYYGYTGYNENGWRCGTMIATSSDPLLLNWTKINDGKAVITDADAPCWKAPDAPPVENQKPYQVFDSYIWKEDGVYYILEAGYTPNKVTGRRYRQAHLLKCENDDLLHWEFVRTFLDNDIFKEPGDDGACPYFVKIGDKRLFLHFSHRCAPKYLIGDYDKENHEFKPFVGGRFTSGYGITVAPSAITLDDGSVLAIFNQAEPRWQEGWMCEMSLPRRFTLGGVWKDELYQSPYCDYSSIHDEHSSVDNLTLPIGEEVVVDSMKGNAFELNVTIPADKIPDTLEISVLRSNAGDEATKVVFMKEQGPMYAILPYNRDSMVMIDTTHSSISRFSPVQPPEIAVLVKEKSEDLNIHIFVDKSIIEVFFNNKQFLTMHAYPEKDDSIGVSFLARGNNPGTIGHADFWTMKSIWD